MPFLVTGASALLVACSSAPSSSSSAAATAPTPEQVASETAAAIASPGNEVFDAPSSLPGVATWQVFMGASTMSARGVDSSKAYQVGLVAQLDAAGHVMQMVCATSSTFTTPCETAIPALAKDLQAGGAVAPQSEGSLQLLGIFGGLFGGSSADAGSSSPAPPADTNPTTNGCAAGLAQAAQFYVDDQLLFTVNCELESDDSYPPTCKVEHYRPNPADEGDGTFDKDTTPALSSACCAALPAPNKATGATSSGAVLVDGTNVPLYCTAD